MEMKPPDNSLASIQPVLSQDVVLEEEVEVIEPKKKTPSKSAFKQQSLPAWKPIYHTRTVLPIFFAVGILFLPVGIGMWFSESCKEITIGYTYCDSLEEKNKTCDLVLMDNRNAKCTCEIPFTLYKNFSGPVRIYYELDNFYQNYGRYHKSRDDKQLKGQLFEDENKTKPQIAPSCAPFDKTDDNKTRKSIYPCGAVANSMFNDEITIFYYSPNEGKIEVTVNKTGIAWESDKNFKFKNPPGFSNRSSLQAFAKPKNWRKNIFELDPDDEEDNGVQNEDFIVWMRTAALQAFRKLYRIVYTKGTFEKGLPAGNYSLRVNYAFEVGSFHGTKAIVLRTSSILGGKNAFLGIAYMVVGSVCLVLGFIALWIHMTHLKRTAALKFSRLHQHPQQNSATTTNTYPTTEKDKEAKL